MARWLVGLGWGLVALAQASPQSPQSPQSSQSPQLPATIAWTAYTLGSTGYNQAVAIGKVLKDHYGVRLRVVPGKNDVSRLLPLVRGRVQYSANGIATVFAQEGVFQFAGRRWGPQPLRLVLTSTGDSNQSLAVSAGAGIRTLGDLRGRRIAWVRGAPALNVSTAAILACADLGWEDVQRVEFPGYNAMWTGIVNGQVDAAYATTVSGTTRRLEATPGGIFWPPLPHADRQCWQRVRRIAPYLTPHMATRGAGISEAQPHEGGTYPYPLLVTMADYDPANVYALVRVLLEHYPDYRDADPGAIGWALERQNFSWVVPWHRGAIRRFRELGVWTVAHDRHNQRLLERQRILRDSWERFRQGAPADTEAFQAGWVEYRAAALMAAELDPIWR